jgi:hypothetical protein
MGDNYFIADIDVSSLLILIYAAEICKFNFKILQNSKSNIKNPAAKPDFLACFY